MARFQLLVEQLVSEHEALIQQLQTKNEQLSLELQSLRPGASSSIELLQARQSLPELTPKPPELEPSLREVADDRHDSTFGFDSTFGYSSHLLPLPATTQQVELQIHALHGLPLHVLQGSPSERPQCKLRIHLGSELQETSWVDLTEERMPHSLSGQLGATFGAAPLIAQLAAWNVPEKVQVDLVVEGASSKFSALVALNAERQHWPFDQGGYVDAEIHGSFWRARAASLASQESFTSPRSVAAERKPTDRSRKGNSLLDAPPPKIYSGDELVERLHDLFQLDEMATKVVMPSDLLAALKSARRGQPQITPSLTVEESEEVMMELRRIHMKVYERGRRQSLSVACQPVMSWKAFQDCILLEDLPNLSHGRSAINVFIVQQALLGEAIPQTSATKALLLAYEKNLRPASNHERWVTVITAASTASIVISFVLLGFSLDMAQDWAGWIVLEAIFSTIFVAEIVVKVAVYGFGGYFCGTACWWNRFDCMLTAVAVIELILNLASISGGEARLVLVLRGLRLARVARLAKLVNLPLLKELANIVSGFIISVRSLFWVIMTIQVVVYVCALALRSLVQSFTSDGFRELCTADPDVMPMDEKGECKLHLVYGEEYCGSVLRCMFSIFRCMIGDCTSAGGRSLTMILSNGFGLRFDLLYALSMVCVLFGLFNIITAIFVEATLNGLKENEIQRKYAKAYETTYMTEQLAKLVVCVSSQTHSLRARKTPLHVSSTRGTLSLGETPEDEHDEEIYLSEEEFNQVIRSPEVRQLLDELDVVVEPRPGVFEAFNTDDSGTVSMSEIVSGLMRLRGDLNKVDIVITQMALENLQKRQAHLASQLGELHAAHMQTWRALETQRLEKMMRKISHEEKPKEGTG